MEKGAVISDCKKYRYKLWRVWDNSRPLVMFIMLNPSTADSMTDDPTIRRCINFAQNWGYGGIYIGNLFAYRSTNPKVLPLVIDPVGPNNNKHLKEMSAICKIVVTAWGNHPKIECKSLEGINMNKFYYLDLTKSGNPRHPLYLKKDLEPKKLTY